MEKVLHDLRIFVKECTDGRDPSHGYEHMNRVAEISHRIWTKEVERGLFPYPPILLVMAAALLHDVADHKYDHDGILREKVQDYVEKDPRLNPYCAGLMWIIDNVSWSKEKRCNGANLAKRAGSLVGYARDIVSDADKSTALGTEGYERCKKYAEETLGLKDASKVAQHIKEHADEKLLRLLPGGYFKTASGRDLAQQLHDELVEILGM